ncbi:MAG: SDR family oxidoreductase [Firmicutes bacterium]|nr:SDR family oxidoreductase [Bacillota bacterium]
MNKYADKLDFTGKTVIVTGALSGAGRSIADVFIESGATVILTYNRSEALKDEVLNRWPGKPIQFIRLDTGNTESIEDFANALEYGGVKVDCLVNNAGIYPAKDIDDVTPEEWDRMFEVNTKGVFFLTQKIRPLMKKGAIINISSINATNPSRRLAHYGASKAAVEMITRSQAQAYGPDVRVNCIAPGLIFKEGQDEYIPGWSDSYKERSALGKLVEPEEIGEICLILASDLMCAVTGQVITADCGVMLAPWFFNEVQ